MNRILDENGQPTDANDLVHRRETPFMDESVLGMVNRLLGREAPAPTPSYGEFGPGTTPTSPARRPSTAPTAPARRGGPLEGTFGDYGRAVGEWTMPGDNVTYSEIGLGAEGARILGLPVGAVPNRDDIAAMGFQPGRAPTGMYADDGRPQFTARNPADGYAYDGPEALDFLESVKSDAAARSAELEKAYSKDFLEIKGMFQLAETPQEKAALAFALQDLQDQRDAGHQAIANGYQTAVQAVGGREADVRALAVEQGQRMGDLYAGAAQSTAANVAAANENVGAGLGLGAVDTTGDASDYIALLDAAAPRQQALAEQLGTIAADDLAYLQGQLGLEQQAQQGDLLRTAMGLSADATNDHNRRVADRIAQASAQAAQAALQLQSDYRNRQFSLDDRDVDLAMEAARIAESRRQSAEDRQFTMDRDYQTDKREFEQGIEAEEWRRGVEREAAQPQTMFEWVTYLVNNPMAIGPAASGQLGREAQKAAIQMGAPA